MDLCTAVTITVLASACQATVAAGCTASAGGTKQYCTAQPPNCVVQSPITNSYICVKSDGTVYAYQGAPD
jgi:hypothetical protein